MRKPPRINQKDIDALAEEVARMEEFIEMDADLKRQAADIEKEEFHADYELGWEECRRHRTQ
jgi:hypothetical protein